MGPQTEITQHLKVLDLLNQHTKEWNVTLIDQILPLHKEQILILKPSLLGAPDKLKWFHNSEGEYTTRTRYYAASKNRENNQTNHQHVSFDLN